MKKKLARVTLPAEVRQLPHPSCLASPRRVRVPNVNGWLNFGKKQAKCYLGQGNSGGGLSRVPETIQMGPKAKLSRSKFTYLDQ